MAALSDLGKHIPTIAVLEDEIVVMWGFLESNQLDYVLVITCLQHFYLALEQLVKFTFVNTLLPFILSLFMDFTATTSSVYWCLPLNTYPN